MSIIASVHGSQFSNMPSMLFSSVLCYLLFDFAQSGDAKKAIEQLEGQLRSAKESYEQKLQ